MSVKPNSLQHAASLERNNSAETCFFVSSYSVDHATRQTHAKHDHGVGAALCTMMPSEVPSMHLCN